MKPFNLKKFKQPKFIFILCLAVLFCGGISYAIMEKVSATPSFCAGCHNMQPYYNSYTSGDLLAKKHADAGVTCHDCHEPSLTQQMDEGVKFVTGNYENPMPTYNFTNEECLKCHNFDDVKTATANLGLENPHDSVHNENGEPPQCDDCHSVHHLQSAQKCKTCHDVGWVLDDSWKK